jgi:DNA primase
MLNPQSWKPKAEALQMGQRQRVDHDCGPGRTLLISRNEDGLRAHCFRCNDSGSSGPPAESLADKIARIRRGNEADAVHAGLRRQPEPAIVDVDLWPAAARLWFYRAGLSRSDIGAIGAYYHAATDRVVLPIRVAGETIYWQARALNGRQPKYIGSSDRPPSMLARWGDAPSPTLCEDILSAYKVGSVGEGWAVMGTSVPSAYIAHFLQRGCAVNVWLDPDPAGQKAARRYIKQLRAYNVEVRNIVSSRDPKLHTRDQIKEYLA